MAESSTHVRMKSMVREELEAEDFDVVEEPNFSTSKRVHWSCYRPDLLAYRGHESGEELAVVECETRPSMKRFTSKNFASFWFQPYLFEIARVRWILAIPQGSLHSINLELREQWEIWILGQNRPLWKIGQRVNPDRKPMDNSAQPISTAASLRQDQTWRAPVMQTDNRARRRA
jgi:hypothetical protein